MSEMMQVTTAAGSVAVRGFGSGDPTVVLLHGIPGSGRSWLAVAERLAPITRVLVPDLLGFGGSARTDDVETLHASGQSRALEEVLVRLDVARAVIVGHDFGGPVALELAGRRPELVGALGLLASNAFGDTPIPFPLSAATWPVLGRPAARILFSRPSLRMMLRQGTGSPRPRTDVGAALGDRGQCAAIRVIFSTSLRRLADLYGPIQDGLARVHVPTLVGWGDCDPFFGVGQGRRTAEVIPAARLRLYRGAGHFLPEERPEDVASDVAQMIAGVSACPSQPRRRSWDSSSRRTEGGNDGGR